MLQEGPLPGNHEFGGCTNLRRCRLSPQVRGGRDGRCLVSCFMREDTRFGDQIIWKKELAPLEENWQSKVTITHRLEGGIGHGVAGSCDSVSMRERIWRVITWD